MEKRKNEKREGNEEEEKKTRDKAAKSEASAGTNMVALDVSDSPDLALTRPTKGGFVFTC